MALSQPLKNLSNDWWTSPGEDQDGMTVLITGRRGMDAMKRSRHYNYRIEITWRYEGDEQGFPGYDDSRLMEQTTDALHEAFDASSVALLVGIYTGAGERNWILYCHDLEKFRHKLNSALASLPATLPLEFHCEDDPSWEEYDMLCQMAIAPDDD